MKKIAFLLILAALLVSCTKNDVPDVPSNPDDGIVQNDVTGEIDTDNTISDDGDNADEHYRAMDYAVTAREWADVQALPLEQKATEFLSALCLKDVDTLACYFQGDSLAELLKADIDAKIGEGKEISVYYNGVETSFKAYVLEVRLDVANSKTDLLPDASYYYTLKISENSPFVEYFGGRERYEIFEGTNFDTTDEALNSAYTFAEQVFHETNLIAENGFDLDSNFDSIFHAAVHDLMAQNDDFVLRTTLDGFKEYIRLRFGYTDESVLDKFANAFTASSFITVDDAGNYSGSCAHGYSSIIKELSTVEAKDDTAVFTYTLFADTAHTIPCAEAEFLFVKNADSTVMTLNNFEYRAVNKLEAAIVSP